MTKEEKLEYNRICGAKHRKKKRIEKGPRVLKDTKKAEATRTSSLKHYHKKKGVDLEGTLASAREHQRLLRLKRDGGPVGRLMKSVMKNILRPYIKETRRLNRQERVNKMRRERYSSDDVYRFRCRLRVRLVTYMRTTGNNVVKSEATSDMVGKPADELLEMLEEKSGLCVDESEVDHIFPLALFDLSDSDNVKRVMHWSNYQLLTVEENRNKKDTLPTKVMASNVERWAWPPGVTEDMLPDIYEGWWTETWM